MSGLTHYQEANILSTAQKIADALHPDRDEEFKKALVEGPLTELLRDHEERNVKLAVNPYIAAVVGIVGFLVGLAF